MWLSKDDDGTICLHKDFPKKIIVNGYVSFSSSEMIVLDECNIEIIGNPIEVILKEI